MAVKAEQHAAKMAERKSAAEPRAHVYIGPNIPGSALRHNTVIAGTRAEIEREFAAEIERAPQIKRLMVPAEKLAEARKAVQDKSTAVSKFYEDARSIFAKDKEELNNGNY